MSSVVSLQLSACGGFTSCCREGTAGGDSLPSGNVGLFQIHLFSDSPCLRLRASCALWLPALTGVPAGRASAHPEMPVLPLRETPHAEAHPAQRPRQRQACLQGARRWMVTVGVFRSSAMKQTPAGGEMRPAEWAGGWEGRDMGGNALSESVLRSLPLRRHSY